MNNIKILIICALIGTYGAIVMLIGLSHSPACPVYPEPVQCIQCDPIPEYVQKPCLEPVICEPCPETYEKELADCEGLRRRYRNLYLKFQGLDYVMATVSGTWKYTKNHNCLNFSREFKKNLEELGISSIIISGTTGDNAYGNLHAWNCVFVEPISGEFVRPEQEYKANKIKL